MRDVGRSLLRGYSGNSTCKNRLFGDFFSQETMILFWYAVLAHKIYSYLKSIYNFLFLTKLIVESCRNCVALGKACF